MDSLEFVYIFISMDNFGTLEYFILFLIVSIYFLPTIIGVSKRNGCAIFVLNLFLGWTFIGWVLALVWAFTKD